MKCMVRNKSRFYYALYLGKGPVLNEDGRPTGETELKYANPVEYEANISASRGSTQAEVFGESTLYDKVIALDDVEIPIDEYSVLWIDTVPELAEDGSLAVDDEGNAKTPHNYTVTRKAVSLNSVLLAVRKVDVS